MTTFDAQSILTKFRALSACHISDGLKQVGGGGGVIHTMQPISSGARMTGFAVTVQCTHKPNGDADRSKYGAATIPGAIGRDEILVLDNDAHDDAVFGLIAAHAIAAQGGAGAVVNGGVRDVNAMSATGLPVFGRHQVIYSGYGYVERVFADSVEIEGVPIAHGDILVGERGGIVVVPRRLAEDVASAARVIEDADFGMIDAIKGGARFVDLWESSQRGSLPFGQR